MDTVVRPSTAELLASVAERSVGGTLRGDYSTIDDQFVVEQRWEEYRPEEHALWRDLYARQTRLLPGRAAAEFLDGLAALDVGDGVPRFEQISTLLAARTGWTLVPVPGLLPDAVFFAHLAHRRFPVTVWLRTPAERDYIVEPDVFHDCFGHVPLLFDPVFAAHYQECGRRAAEALQQGGLSMMARLYWYTVEFGLIREAEGLRAYGAGILSSSGEIQRCLSCPSARRVPFALERVMATAYRIDAFQPIYFVIDRFEQLFEAMQVDFAPIYARWRDRGPVSPDDFDLNDLA